MLSMYIVVRYPQTAVGDAGLIFVSLCFSLINASFTLATIFLRCELSLSNCNFYKFLILFILGRGELKRMFFGIKVFWLLTRFFWNAYVPYDLYLTDAYSSLSLYLQSGDFE